MSTTRVLLADDQALVREGFRHIIDAREDLEVERLVVQIGRAHV